MGKHDSELEKNEGIRKREEEIEQKRKRRIQKFFGLIGLIILFGAGTYVSRMVYTDYLKKEEQSVIAVNSTFLEPVTSEEAEVSEELETSASEMEASESEVAEENVMEQVQEQETALEELTSEETSEASTEDLEVTTDINKDETDNKQDEVKDTASNETTEKNDQYLCISTVNVNLRSKPSATASVVGKILPKTVVTVVNHDTKGWFYVSYNGMEGYVIDSALEAQ